MSPVLAALLTAAACVVFGLVMRPKQATSCKAEPASCGHDPAADAAADGCASCEQHLHNPDRAESSHGRF